MNNIIQLYIIYNNVYYIQLIKLMCFVFNIKYLDKISKIYKIFTLKIQKHSV